MEDGNNTDRDLGNGEIYHTSLHITPKSPQDASPNTTTTPKRPAISWASTVLDANEAQSGTRSRTSLQNGHIHNIRENGSANPGYLNSRHHHRIGGRSACVIEIRKSSTQNGSQTILDSPTSNHIHLRTDSEFVDLMKNRRIESIKKNAECRNREEQALALLGDFHDRDKPFRSKMDFFGSALSFMLGLGNVIRFSTLCHQNGGGAFFIPYFILLVLEGIPLLCLEMAIGQRYGKISLTQAWRNLVPSLSGLGLAAIVENIFLVFYYNILVSWCLYFCVQSLRNSLLWEPCPVTTTFKGNQTINSMERECAKSGPEKYFWYRKSLDASEDINTFSGFNMFMYIFVILAWLSAWLLSMKEIRQSSKACLAVLLLIIAHLVIFFFVAVNQEGWAQGLAMLFAVENLDSLKDIKVWMAAAEQIFYSMGIGAGSTIMFSSGNRINNNFYADALLLSLANSGTSVWASIIMFSFFGFRMHYKVEQCLSVMESNSSLAMSTFMMSSNIEGNATASVLANGTSNCSKHFFFKQIPQGKSLVFVGMSQAFGEMDKSSVYSCLFFFLLFLLGVSSIPGMLHIIIEACTEFKILPKSWRREIVAGLVCLLVCLSNLLFVQSPALYILEIIDSASGFPLLVIAFCECIGISYVYGIDKFSKDILIMTGKELPWKWKLCWKFVSPAIILGLIIGSLINMVTSQRYYEVWDRDKGQLTTLPYPPWAYVLYCFTTFVPILFLAYPLAKTCVEKLRTKGKQGQLIDCGACKALYATCRERIGERSGSYDLTAPENNQGFNNNAFEMSNSVQENGGTAGNNGVTSPVARVTSPVPRGSSSQGGILVNNVEQKNGEIGNKNDALTSPTTSSAGSHGYDNKALANEKREIPATNESRTENDIEI